MKKFLLPAVVLMIYATSCKHKAPSGSAVSGLSVFEKNCARCHGPTGVEGKAPDLSKIAYTKEQTLDIVKHGYKHMPAFEDKLTTQELEAVTTYVMALKK